jgi:hypothetical protein
MIVGKRYTIELSPAGNVVKVVDANEARLAARRGSVIPVDALSLLRPEAIASRHSLIMLPPLNANKITVGGKWSKMKEISFGLMGSKSYEKVYALTQVKDIGGRKIALIRCRLFQARRLRRNFKKRRKAVSRKCLIIPANTPARWSLI